MQTQLLHLLVEVCPQGQGLRREGELLANHSQQLLRVLGQFLGLNHLGCGLAEGVVVCLEVEVEGRGVGSALVGLAAVLVLPAMTTPPSLGEAVQAAIEFASN